MVAAKPQRPARSATASQPPPTKYNDSQAIGLWVQWADDNGVIAVALIVGQRVRTNAPLCSFADKTLEVLLTTSGTVQVVNTRTGAEHTFTGLPPEVVA